MNFRSILTGTLLVVTFGMNAICQETGFSVTEKIPYKSGDAYVKERCYVNIRVPDKAGSYPVVVWFHGGGLTGGEPYFPEPLMDNKIVLVAVSYRLYPGVQESDCIDDAAAAVAWTFHHISEYKGNSKEIIVSGHSAGGYLTSMIGLDKKWLDAYGIDADRILALFPFSGHAITHFTERKARGIPGTQPVVDEMAPIYYVRKDAPPLYLITGDRELELLGRYEENAYMWRMMKLVGHTKTYLFEIGGHDHGAMVNPACHILETFLSDYE